MAVCDVPVIHTVCNVAVDAAGTVVMAPFAFLAQGMATLAKILFLDVWKVIDTTTYVDVTTDAYTRVYNLIFGIAIFLMLGFFMLQVIGAMIRREPAALTRAALGIAKSILASFVALTLLATALEITDQLCIGIVNAAGTNMDEMGDKVGVLIGGLTTINLTAPGAGAILTIFLSGMAIAGAMVVWMSLLVRKALLLLAIVFAPIALAGSSWDHTRSWLSRWATFVIAMILSKLVLVVIFLLATAQVAAPVDADLQSVSQPITGVVLMLMAGFAPYLTYKAIAFMGFDMYHAMSAEQEAKGALNRPLPIPLSATRGGAGGGEPQKVLSGGEGGGGSTSVGPGSPAPTAPTDGSRAVGTGTSAAAEGIGLGAAAAKEVATAGPKLGNFVAATASSHTDAAATTSPPPPHVADPTLTGHAKKS